MSADLLFTTAASASASTALVFGGEIAPAPAGNPLDLVFRDAPASADLVFGNDWTAPTGGVSTVSIEASFPSLLGVGVLRVGRQVTVTAPLPCLAGLGVLRVGIYVSGSTMLPGLIGSGSASYFVNVQRPRVARLHATAQVADQLSSGITQQEQHALPLEAGFAPKFQDATAAGITHAAGFTETVRAAKAYVSKFSQGIIYRDGMKGRMQEADRSMRTDHHGLMQDGSKAQTWPKMGTFQDGLHDRRNWLHAKYQEAVRANRGLSSRAGYAAPHSKAWHSCYQTAWVPRPGMHIRPIPPIPVWQWGLDLVFACLPLEFPALVFGLQQCAPDTPTGAATLYILPARFYMTTHSIYAQRLPDLADVPIFDATVSADSGSYCWSLSATGPASLMELLAPVAGLPAQLRVTLDGMPWVFAVDSVARTRSFGKSGVQIQGRSVTALISAPYLRATTRDNASADATAQQLTTDALQYSGVDLDWGLTDWLVPAGAWSHQGTPLDAVQAIAQTAGGYLQSHRSLATLQTRHPYSQRTGDLPGAPWGWMTGAADVELAPDALITESLARKDGPDINGVYVSGTTAGVLALVKRSGTAADKLSSMVTDALITHVDAARQRGLSILGAAGNKYAVTLDLPVLTGIGQPGVIDVGQLVQVNAAEPWRGRVLSVSVAAKAPSLRQTITLERHLETV